MLRRLTADQQRSVRHWGMEFVVVVAGVLLALWLQQWGERRHAMQDMAVAEDAIHDELRETLKNLIWREAIGQCHVDRAELLKSMLLADGSRWPGLSENALIENSMKEATGVRTVMQGVYQRPADPFPSAAWNSALTTGALAPMDRKRFAKLTDIYYAGVQFLADNQERENRAATTLSALALPQELTPATRTTMLGALYEVDTSRFTFAYAGSEFAEGMKELGWSDKAEIDRWIAEERAEDIKRGAKWRPCVKPERNPFA